MLTCDAKHLGRLQWRIVLEPHMRNTSWRVSETTSRTGKVVFPSIIATIFPRSEYHIVAVVSRIVIVCQNPVCRTIGFGSATRS